MYVRFNSLLDIPSIRLELLLFEEVSLHCSGLSPHPKLPHPAFTPIGQDTRLCSIKKAIDCKW